MNGTADLLARLFGDAAASTVRERSFVVINRAGEAGTATSGRAKSHSPNTGPPSPRRPRPHPAQSSVTLLERGPRGSW